MRTNWSGCTKHYASSGLFKYYIGIRLTIQFLLTLTLWARHFTLQKWTTTPFTTWMYVYIYRKFNIWSWYMFILIILNRINHKRPSTIEKLTAFKELPTIINILKHFTFTNAFVFYVSICTNTFISLTKSIWLAFSILTFNWKKPKEYWHYGIYFNKYTYQNSGNYIYVNDSGLKRIYMRLSPTFAYSRNVHKSRHTRTFVVDTMCIRWTVAVVTFY